MTAVTVSARNLLRMFAEVLPHVSRDVWIPQINQVHVTLGDGYLSAVATDRYTVGASRLAVESQESAAVGLGLADVERIARVFRPGRKEDPQIRLTFGSGLVVEDPPAFGMEIGTRLVCAKPEKEFIASYARVLQIGDDEEIPRSVAFNPHYMARFAQAQRPGEYMIVRNRAERRAVLVHIGDHFSGAIMPVNISHAEDLSWWLKDAAAQESEATEVAS